MYTLKKNTRIIDFCFFIRYIVKKHPTTESNFQGLSCIGGDLYLTAGILVLPKYLFYFTKTNLMQTHTWSNGNLRFKNTLCVIKTSSLDQLLTWKCLRNICQVLWSTEILYLVTYSVTPWDVTLTLTYKVLIIHIYCSFQSKMVNQIT